MKSVRIIIFSFVLLIVTFLSLGGRCIYLQLLKGDHYSAISTKQLRGWVPQKPQRGVILDCQGRMLAASNRIRTVFAEPRVIKDPKSISVKLAPILDMGAHEVCKLIMESKNPGFAKIKVGVGVEQCNVAGEIYGIGVQSDWQRYYPMRELAAHIVGFTSVYNRGLGGIELQYDEELSGLGAQSIFFADALRRPIRPFQQQAGVSSHFADGVGIILTLDASIQQFARAELVNQYESYEAESAVAIVAEPKTGAILAMVSLPDFDPRDARSADANTLRNRAVCDQFEPGSVLKPIVAAIAIDAGAVGREEKIFCEYGDYRGRGFGRIGEYGNHKFGDLAVRDILVHSSNIGMAKIGQKLGRDKLYDGLRLFGFGKKIGIDLPGEAEGRLWPVRNWTGYSVTRIPYGQEISVTAIQLVRAFCILANGGRVVQPYLVKAIVGNNGEIIKLQRPSLTIGYVVKPEVAEWIITEALVGVVDEGTGKRARLDGWEVFGKTGTANIAKSDERGYSERDYVASFVGGAPATDPAVVVLVSIRRPSVELGKGYTGGTVAAPACYLFWSKTCLFCFYGYVSGYSRAWIPAFAGMTLWAEPSPSCACGCHPPVMRRLLCGVGKKYSIRYSKKWRG
ncbi:MAG: peptidoglycan D,D-transpeptidase FtsI family protein [Planctomycetota bacterium]